MTRISLTRLVDSATRAVLLIPCLLICLACATPFPFEKLEEGMTADGVRQTVGEPKSVGKERGYSYFFYADGWNETVAIRFDGDERVHGWVSWRDTPWWDPGGCAWKCAFDERQWRDHLRDMHHLMDHDHMHLGRNLADVDEHH